MQPSSFVCLSAPWGCCSFSASSFPPCLRAGGSSSAVALVGLLGLVCCQPRHSARRYSGSPCGRHSGLRCAQGFFRLALGVAAGFSWCFPLVQLPKVCHHDSPSECSPVGVLLRGLMPPAPPSMRGQTALVVLITLVAVAAGGCLPPSALPPGVFHGYGLAPSTKWRLAVWPKTGHFCLRIT